jgi:FtsP/CotA-like multicopper oxidase with cupredoxin domain
MDHSKMDHAAPAETQATAAANADPRGWAAGAPAGSRVLQYADLKASKPNEVPKRPVREIVMRLGGSMERYMWTIDGHQHDAPPIKVTHGERLRIIFINETMMAHPMHLHGMFFELDSDLGDRNPLKHTVTVPPGQSVPILLTADEFGKWALHCHLLYHMLTGMMTEIIVLDADGQAPPWY